MSDMAFLCETWPTTPAEQSDYIIDGYDTPHLVNAGHGKDKTPLFIKDPQKLLAAGRRQ